MLFHRNAGPDFLSCVLLCCCAGVWFGSPLLKGQETVPKTTEDTAPRGSVIEDRAARKLLEVGELREAAGESEKAMEIWQSVIERYPRSRVRFSAYLKLGDFFLNTQRAFDRARTNFELAASEENPDPEERALAMLKLGISYSESRLHGKAFATFRDLIQQFPNSPEVNRAWYHIGLGHFKQGHYSRAIEALEKVGTNLGEGDAMATTIEAGKRLYVRIDDQDLALLEPGETVKVQCKTLTGDTEVVDCLPLGRNTAVVLGSVPTRLGSPAPQDGVLQVRGGEKVEIVYTDEFTAKHQLKEKRISQVAVVGSAQVRLADGSYADSLDGVVIGKTAHLQIIDADFDRTDQADSLSARAEIWRLKSNVNPAAETPPAPAPAPAPAAAPTPAATADPAAEAPAEEVAAERYEKIDTASVSLTEFSSAETGPIHTAIFRGGVLLEAADKPKEGDAKLQCQPGDQLRLVYDDELNQSGKPCTLVAVASCVEGNLGEVRVTRPAISDQTLRLKTQLETASALTKIGTHYQEFGLAAKANAKFEEALLVVEAVVVDAGKIGGPILEQTYVQLWRTYFALEKLDLAGAVCDRLIRQFPESAFIDEAVLQQSVVARKRKEFGRAISLLDSLLKLQRSPLRGEAQFGMGEVYEEMAAAARGSQSAEAVEQIYEKAFLAYQAVYEKFPESGRVGEAVARMANFYYQKKDYARAIDVFTNVLKEHPDASFLDVILFNYGRCLYRLDRKKEAREQFDHLLAEFPSSTLATEARQIGEALEKAGF